ncbi:hypothetical protein, partial [Pseudomonas syringae group genomosp. 3]|uniref:hypothetical protein n=1 Tax=Pseudomonas syringae group genomosp. 3 TaxID=251701 RepID=UPI001E497FC9
AWCASGYPLRGELKNKKPGALAGFDGWCLSRYAVAPIEDDYFLQVDSGGSKPVLMPPTNM